MSAGSIIIDLLMRTGSFVTDTKRAQKQLKEFQKDVAGTAASLKNQLVGALAAAGVALSFDALLQGAAKFKDLEEEVGASAESIASLSVAAATAGVPIESIAASALKLTKNLSGVDDESKAAGAALAALGIPIEEFKRLDPVQRIDALAKAFAGFADGPEKSAVAIALFGKAGAEQLRVFKALEEQGGRQVILTQQQIELADAFADRQSKLTGTLQAYAQVAVTDILPSLNDLTAVTSDIVRELVGVDAAGKKLAGDSSVAQFARGAADVLAFVADIAQGVVSLVQSIGVGFGANAAIVSAVLDGEFGQARTIAEEARNDIARILNPELFSQRLARLRAEAARASAPDPNQSAAESARLGRRPQLKFDGAVKPPKGTTTQSEAEKYLETLQKQGEATLQLTTYEKALLEIQSGRLKGITPQLKRAILAQAAVPAVAYSSKPRSANLFTGKIIERLSRSATDTKMRPEVGNPFDEAANCDFANATPNVSSMPMTSPVDFISGPSTVSTPWKRLNGSTASFTATGAPAGTFAASPTAGSMPLERRSAIVSPSAMRAAAFASCTAVALATNGTVRLARGLASST